MKKLANYVHQTLISAASLHPLRQSEEGKPFTLSEHALGCATEQDRCRLLNEPSCLLCSHAAPLCRLQTTWLCCRDTICMRKRRCWTSLLMQLMFCLCQCGSNNREYKQQLLACSLSQDIFDIICFNMTVGVLKV